MKEQSTRQLKVGQEVKFILSNIFMRGDIYDPETKQALQITISEVRVSPDMHNATVFFMPLGGKDKDKMPAVLNGLSHSLKKQLFSQLKTKYVPNLIFRLDDTFDNVSRLEEVLSHN
jgi:ribosome-binding factor A